MRKEFVDDHRAQALWTDRLEVSRRASDGVARSPGLALVLAVAGSRQHERGPPAIGGGGPRMTAVVIHFEQHEAVIVPQSNASTIVRQVVGERAKHARDAVNGLQVRRRARHDDEAAAWQDRAGWEDVIDIAGKPVAGDVLVIRIRVVNLHELQLGLVRSNEHIARMIHDFRDDESGLAARRPKRFGAGRNGVHGAAGRRREIAELRGGSLVRIVAGDREAEIKTVRQSDADRAKRRPIHAVLAGESREQIACALQPQPHARITRWERTAAGRQPACVGTRLQETASERGRGERGGETAVRAKRFASHQAGLRKQVGEVESEDAHADVEVSCHRLPRKLELVLLAADRAAANHRCRTTASQVHRASLGSSADRLRVEFLRSKRNLYRQECVGRAGTVENAADGKHVIILEHER